MSKAAKKKVFRLPPHSVAKISVYKRYLSIYLSVLANTPFKPIYLIDLFAGEGRDIDGKASSSIAALEAIKNHYDTARNVCKEIKVFLNDYGNSEIEPRIKKIERIKRFAKEIGLPAFYEVVYSDEKFENIIEKVIERLNRLTSLEKALCFLDPWGYKYSKPKILKDLLSNGKTEILLFIPICFIHRFAGKALKDVDYIEGKHIEQFLSELYSDSLPEIGNQVQFIKGIQNQFRKYLNVAYVDVIFIEKEPGQYFALYFFSNSKRGFQKMLEAKWSLDEKDGKGFSVTKNLLFGDLFNNIDHENYSYTLYEFIKNKKVLTNQELFDFGLENNHLPKHTKKVLDELKKEDLIKVETESGQPALGYYLEDNHEKKVFIKIK